MRPKVHTRSSYLALLVMLIASLSCVTTPGEAPPIVAADEEIANLIQVACDGTSSLQVTSEITSQETNQFGTKVCEYTLKITNNHEDAAIRFYIYQHDKDGYQRTEKSHWMGNVLVEPGKVGGWPASIYIYSDPDADGPVMSIPEKIAGVYDTQECAGERQDEKFFEQISIPIEAVCPVSE